MSDKKYIPVIVIAREYYAGGMSLARRLSERLGIPWYDHDLDRLAAKVSGYSVEEIRNEGEELTTLEKVMGIVIGNPSFYVSSHDEIHSAQKNIVLELAKEPCIIVGRGANSFLEEKDIDSFNIFLYADRDVRIQRYMNNNKGIDRNTAEKLVEKHDQLRRNFYNKYFGEGYDDCRNFNLCLDTGTISFDKCAEIVESIISG